MPWATDLLPDEIDKNIELVKRGITPDKNIVWFVGMHHHTWDGVRDFCTKNGIEYKQCGGFVDNNNNVDSQTNCELIQKSLVAPAVQSNWQVTHGYIPCRIFKNISYGKMGMTNSPEVYNLFSGRIFYSPNIDQLMRTGISFEKQSIVERANTLVPLMEYVRDQHTYLNRIDTILEVFKKQTK